jgi:tetratricopeptide (TPR) repeat protein
MFGDSAKESVSELSEDAIMSIMMQSKDLLVVGRMEDSIDVLLPIFKSNPDHIETNALTGAILLSMQQFDLAEQFLYSAVSTSQWKHAGAVSNLAQLFLKTGATDLAAKTLSRGLAATENKDETGALSLCFGDVAYSQQQYAQAAEWYLSAAVKRPTNVDIWVKASTVRYPTSGRNLKLAENVLMQGLASNRNSAELLFCLGLSLHGRQQLPEAITFYEQALRTVDGASSSSSATGSSGAAAGAGAGAVDTSEMVIALATALHASGAYAQALPWYLRAQQQADNASASATAGAGAGAKANVVLLANHALLLHALGRGEEARHMLARAQAADPSNADVLRAAAEINAPAAL